MCILILDYRHFYYSFFEDKNKHFQRQHGGSYFFK